MSQPRTPPDLYEAICQLRPEGKRNDFFFLEARAGDGQSTSLVEQVVAMCRERGLKQTRGETVGSYAYSAARKYEPDDLRGAALLFLVGGRGFLRGVRRNELGLLEIPAAQATATLKLKAVFPAPWIVVSDAVRRALNAEGLVGLDFREVVVVGHSLRAAKTQFWELTSCLTLPKMLNSVLYENHPYTCYGIDDDSYQRPEVHYRENEIRKIGIFDVAHTLEPVGHRDPSLIVSQRFYRCCLSHEISLDVWPVRIDPDQRLPGTKVSKKGGNLEWLSV